MNDACVLKMSHAAGKQTKNAPLNFEPKNVNFWPIKFQPKFAFYTNSQKSDTLHTHLSLSLSLSLFCSFLCSKIFSEVKRRGNDDECDLYVLARYFCGGVFARNDESIRKGRKMMRENHHHHHHHRRSCIGNENFTDRDFRRLCSSSSSSSRRGGKGKGAEERRRRLSSLTASSSSPSSSSSQQKKYCVSTVDASAILVPHPDKSATGGEDSCFVLKRSNAFGVFDGVGGWSDEGVNPAEYSETFASEAAKAVTKEKMRNPVDIMVRAHKMTRVVGSSTACVCVVEEGEATFANVGDAGGIVARNGACVFKTEPMQHEFNMPFQLGWKEAYPETDDPRRADVKKVRLKRGDCVVLGSDGLWDNVPHEDVAILCDENEGDAVKCAEQIARLAFSRSTDEEYDSPFMIAARREGMELTWAEKLQGVKLTGGKMDDIAVVVAFVG